MTTDGGEEDDFSGLAEVCEKAWGQARLDKDKKKELSKDAKVPSNCPRMKTPRLNTEIYVRLPENSQTKDRAAQERQKDLTKAVIPLLKALDKVSGVQDLMKQNAKRDTAKYSVAKRKKRRTERWRKLIPWANSAGVL